MSIATAVEDEGLDLPLEVLDELVDGNLASHPCSGGTATTPTLSTVEQMLAELLAVVKGPVKTVVGRANWLVTAQQAEVVDDPHMGLVVSSGCSPGEYRVTHVAAVQSVAAGVGAAVVVVVAAAAAAAAVELEVAAAESEDSSEP